MTVHRVVWNEPVAAMQVTSVHSGRESALSGIAIIERGASMDLASREPTPYVNDRRLDAAACARLLRELDLGMSSVRTIEQEAAVESGLPHVPGYLIHGMIGAGGGGEVYYATRTGTSLEFAIKLLRHDHSRAGARADQSERELSCLMGLKLSSVPRLVDHGTVGGRRFLVTEYVRGVPIDAFCRGERWHPGPWHCAESDRRSSPGSLNEPTASVHTRVTLLVNLCRAVQELHERGVIHRDLKPANVLVDNELRVHVIDLGVSRLNDSTERLQSTAPGTVLGTPEFMPPEVARGEGAFRTRGDIYSLGALAMYLLAGSHPHDLRGLPLHAAITRIATTPAPLPRLQAVPRSRELSAILAKAVCFDPEHRYASAQGMQSDLEAWRTGRQVSAVLPGPWVRVTQWAGQHPRASTAVGMIALLIVGSVFALAAGVGRVATSFGHIAWDEHRSTATAFSRLGLPMQTWASGRRDGILCAERIEVCPTFPRGGALVAVAPDADRDPHSVGLYDAASMTVPKWEASFASGSVSVPATLGNYSHTEFVLRQVSMLDVVAGSQHSEPEIVLLAHARGRSATVLRVLSLSGQVLGEWWHDGQLTSFHWLPLSRRIVLAGVSNDLPVRDLGYVSTAPDAGLYAFVVFAIDLPQNAERLEQVLADTPTVVNAGRGTAWYSVVHPLSTVDSFAVPEISRRRDASPGTEAARLALHRRDGQVASTSNVAYLQIDGSGNVLSEVLSDGLRLSGGPLLETHLSLQPLSAK